MKYFRIWLQITNFPMLNWRIFFLRQNSFYLKKEEKLKWRGKKYSLDLVALDWRKRSKMRQLMLHKLKVKTQLDLF